MANIASARKRARQSEVNRQRNKGARSMMRSYVKKVTEATASGDKAAAQAAYNAATSVIDKVAGKGIMHKNAASRLKSRLNKHIAAL